MPIFEIELTSLTYGGDAFGRLPDGRAVFVPFAVSGERVTVRLVEEKRSYVRAELVDVLRPSPQRLVPRCTHYGVCGGCHYQHMDYPAQLAAKQAILREQLERIGGIPDAPVGTTVASPQPWGYRNHVQFHLTPDGKLGYQRGHSTEAFQLKECFLPESAISTVWPQLDLEPFPGLERIGVRLGAEDDLQMILESSMAETPELSVEELPLSVVHLSPWGSLVLAGSQSITMEVLGRLFRVSAGSFFQVNTPVAEAMVTYLLTNLPLQSQDTILELYCGVGLFTAFLAERCARLVGVEASSFACADFETNLETFDNVELYEASAEQVLGSSGVQQPDFVIADPPRLGLGKEVAAGILALQPRCIAYVSCDPATLARDARQFIEGGYRLAHCTPFDAFPQTYHIESISIFLLT